MSSYQFCVGFVMAIFVGLMVYGYCTAPRLSRSPRVTRNPTLGPRGVRDGRGPCTATPVSSPSTRQTARLTVTRAEKPRPSPF